MSRATLVRHHIFTLLPRSISVRRSSDQCGPNFKVLKLNHVAIATADLDKVASFYRNVLNIKTSEVTSLPNHGVDTVFIELGNTKFELLRQLGNNSPIKGFMEKNKHGGMHHVCLEVDNIKAAIEHLRKCKIRLLSEEPSIGAHGKPVIFLHPKDCGGVLMELEEV